MTTLRLLVPLLACIAVTPLVPLFAADADAGADAPPVSKPVDVPVTDPVAGGAASASTDATSLPTTTTPAPNTTATAANKRDPLPRWAGRLVLGAGYDSNALLLEDVNAVVTDLGGATLWADAQVRLRILNDRDHRLEVALSAEYDWSTNDEARQMRIGGNAIWARRVGAWLPGAAIGAYQYSIDNEKAASVISGSFSMNRPAPTWAALPSIEVLVIDYPDAEPASATQVALNYRHWFIPQASNPRTRWEAGLRIGTNQAEADYESYLTIKPSVTYRLHPTGSEELERWDFASTLGFEYRAYDEGTTTKAERNSSGLLSIEGDRRLNSWLSTGAFVALSGRDSNIDTRDYNRFQIGLRASAAF